MKIKGSKELSNLNGDGKADMGVTLKVFADVKPQNAPSGVTKLVKRR